MIRDITSLLFTSLFTCLITPVFAQSAPVLRATVLVASDLVHIGDLVENVAPEKAHIALYRAPNLGQTGSVPVAKVLEALRPHDVFGISSANLTEVSVTRASRVVGTDEIRARIAGALAERMRVTDPANVALTFDAPLQAIHLDPANNAPLNPARVSFDPRSGRFEVAFKTDGVSHRVTGTAGEAHETLVLTRALARGDIVKESDVAVERRPKSDIQGDAVRDAAAAIGLAVQQPLRPGQPVRSSDLVRPQLVKRGEPVLLLFEVPGIVLTARGKAEESGAIGDVVNITNVQSKRVVQGTVTAPGQVTVTSMTPRITSAQANLTSMQRTALNSARP